MKLELAALDIAGTTVDERGAVYATLRDAVEADGARVSGEDLERWKGADKVEAVRELLGGDGDEQRVARVHDDFRARLHDAYRREPPVPMAGVPEAFAALRARGVRIALTTGFDHGIADALLERLGWNHRIIDAVVCAEDVAQGRPAPYMIFRAMELTGVHAAERVLVAGDTARDLEAGTNAGAGAVAGVLSGHVDARTLGRHRHTHMLAGVADIPALVA